jgi:hypothetical protein
MNVIVNNFSNNPCFNKIIFFNESVSIIFFNKNIKKNDFIKEYNFY